MSDMQHDLRAGQLRCWKNGLGVFFIVEIEGFRCDLMQCGQLERRFASFVSRNSTII